MIPAGSQIIAGGRQTPGLMTYANKTDPGGVAHPLPFVTPPGAGKENPITITITITIRMAKLIAKPIKNSVQTAP
jgi:hypothetical protein